MQEANSSQTIASTPVIQSIARIGVLLCLLVLNISPAWGQSYSTISQWCRTNLPSVQWVHCISQALQGNGPFFICGPGGTNLGLCGGFGGQCCTINEICERNVCVIQIPSGTLTPTMTTIPTDRTTPTGTPTSSPTTTTAATGTVPAPTETATRNNIQTSTPENLPSITPSATTSPSFTITPMSVSTRITTRVREPRVTHTATQTPTIAPINPS